MGERAKNSSTVWVWIPPHNTHPLSQNAPVCGADLLQPSHICIPSSGGFVCGSPTRTHLGAHSGTFRRFDVRLVTTLYKTFCVKPRACRWLSWINIFTVLVEPVSAYTTLDQVAPGRISPHPRNPAWAVYTHVFLFRLSVPSKSSRLWWGYRKAVKCSE